MKTKKELKALLRETVMRCQIALPETEQDLNWFDQGCSIRTSGDFFERIVTELDLGNVDELFNPEQPHR